MPSRTADSADLTKRIWFLVPKVKLCEQQCLALQAQIPSVLIMSLSSANGVDNWRNKKVWDSALTNVRIVVATYAVLQNALDDAFVTMDSIALIVMDEGKICTRLDQRIQLTLNKLIIASGRAPAAK